jgi:subtilisin family serine protease
LSLGGAAFSQEDEDAIAYAESHNVVLVGASGNEGLDKQSYPADYPGVIAVGGITENDTVWDGEDYGYVTVVAPAADIVADNNGSDTEMFKGDGTSAATAYVSAIAALVRAKYPNLTAGQVVNRIIKTALLPQGVTSGDPKWGYGIARPYAALTDSVPAGPAGGPLPQATQSASAAASSPATSAGGSSKGLTIAALLPLVLLGIVVLVVVLVIVLVVRRRGNRNGPGGLGPGTPAQYPPYPQPQAQQPPFYSPGPSGYQPPQSVHPNNPYAQPPQQPPGGQPH